MSTTVKIAKNKEQDEIQSAYFGHNSFSIFTACCYTRGSDGTILNENFTVTSEATDHSRIAAFSYINLITDSLQKKFPSQFNNYPVFYIWSDGCPSQFRSRFVFALMTHFNPDYTRKGPMDGVGGTVKNMIFQHVKSKKCVINGAIDFAEYANKIMVFLAFTWPKTKSWQSLKIRNVTKNSKNIKSSESFKNL